MSFNLHRQSRFSQIHKIDNSGIIAICVFTYISRLLPYSNCIVLVNAKLDITGYNRITYQGWILWWSSKFEMPHLKQNWQHWHSCIAGSMWKPRMPDHLSAGFSFFIALRYVKHRFDLFHMNLPFIQRAYITYVRQVKRIDNMRKSPVFSHFDESIVGASSIR